MQIDRDDAFKGRNEGLELRIRLVQRFVEQHFQWYRGLAHLAAGCLQERLVSASLQGPHCQSE